MGMVTFGQRIHTRLCQLDDQGQAYQIRIDYGSELDVVDHSAEVLEVTRAGRPVSETIYFDLKQVRCLEIIEI